MCSLSGKNMYSNVRNVWALFEKNTCSRSGICVLHLEKICVPGQECVVFI
jgi:hypothetical protein